MVESCDQNAYGDWYVSLFQTSSGGIKTMVEMDLDDEPLILKNQIIKKKKTNQKIPKDKHKAKGNKSYNIV